MNKDEAIRLLEKVIDQAPAYITAIAGLITALSTRKEQKKKRKPKSNKR